MDNVRFTQRRAGWLALALIVACVAAALTPSLVANPDHEITYLYYFDAAKTQPAGAKYIECDGVTLVGTQTAHITVEIGDTCPGSACTEELVDPFDPTKGFKTECGPTP